jgi:hypothetical protein
MAAFWDDVPCTENLVSKVHSAPIIKAIWWWRHSHLWNVGHLRDYTAQYPRRLPAIMGLSLQVLVCVCSKITIKTSDVCAVTKRALKGVIVEYTFPRLLKFKSALFRLIMEENVMITKKLNNKLKIWFY